MRYLNYWYCRVYNTGTKQ